MTTNDKQSKTTMELIKRRERLRNKKRRMEREIIELAELRKLIKENVRKVVKEYKEEIICGIMGNRSAVALQRRYGKN